ESLRLDVTEDRHTDVEPAHDPSAIGQPLEIDASSGDIGLYGKLESGVLELDVPQLGALSIQPHHALDVGMVAAAGRLETQPDEGGVGRGDQLEAVLVQELIGEEHIRVRSVERET